VAWFGARGFRDDVRRDHLLVVAITAVAALLAVAGSLVIWGLAPWQDYRQVVAAGAGAEIVDRRNAGIAVQIVLLAGGDEGMARVLHVVVGIGAVLATVWAAWTRPDPVESFAWAAVASLATLPVTWYHYPSALIPIALVAILRAGAAATSRATIRLVLAAGVMGGIGIAVLPLLWVAAGLVILAARVSAPLNQPAQATSRS
jgi:hypothetical protein